MLEEALPQTLWVADEQFKESDQVHVPFLGVLARKTPHGYCRCLCIYDLRPLTENAPWPSLQPRIGANNFLVCTEDVPVKEKSNHFLAYVGKQVSAIKSVHLTILQPMPGAGMRTRLGYISRALYRLLYISSTITIAGAARPQTKRACCRSPKLK